MSVENKAIIRRLYEEFWNKRNLKLADEIISPSHALYEPLAADSKIGPKAYRATAERFHAGLHDLHFGIQDLISEQNKVVAVWVLSGTHQGEFLGLPPTNKKVSIEGITIHQIENGKIFDSHASWDTLGLMRQLGGEAPRKQNAAGGAHGS